MSNARNRGRHDMGPRDGAQHEDGAQSLFDEFVNYAATITPQGTGSTFEALGCSSRWLWGDVARYGVARGRGAKTGLWRPSPDGDRMCVLPVPPLAEIADPGWPTQQLDDLVAFHPDRPDKWWTRNGAAILGQEAVERAAAMDEPLYLFPTPLDWLVAEGHGACVLDWTAPLGLYLGGPRLIRCMSRDLPPLVRKALGKNTPRIQVVQPPSIQHQMRGAA